MTDGLNIRIAHTQDASLLNDISITTFTESYSAYNTPENMELYITEHFNTPQLEKELIDKHNAFFLATRENKPIGYAKLSAQRLHPQLEGTNAIEIERFYVLRQYHAQKIGAALMQYCIDYARANNYDTLWLGVWEHNPKAISFYSKWGFEVFGSYLFKFGNDLQTDLLMKRWVE